jgi:hypothetical protein
VLSIVDTVLYLIIALVVIVGVIGFVVAVFKEDREN